jgi:hypothetical protein
MGIPSGGDGPKDPLRSIISGLFLVYKLFIRWYNWWNRDMLYLSNRIYKDHDVII